MAFPLTANLKTHMIKSFGVSPKATDDVFQKAIAKAVVEKKLNSQQIITLTRPAQPVRRVAPAGVKSVQTPVRRPVVSHEALDRRVQEIVQKTIAQKNFVPKPSTPSPGDVMRKSHEIRVKSALENYSSVKKAAVFPEYRNIKGKAVPHEMAGKQATFDNTVLEHPSDRDKAIAAAYFKWSLSKQLQANETPRWLKMTDHDKDIMQHTLRNERWTGFVGSEQIPIKRAKLGELHVKTLLDDSTSGGIEATPIAFDDAIVLLPVLYGELFPLVNVVNVTRGRRMKGALLSQPSFTSGVAEGTAITPFTTTAMVSAFDTTIYNAVGALEMGIDMEEDSPVDLGSRIIEYYGLKAQEWLDRVIAYGNGTTEPLGILLSTGLVSVPSDNGVGGPCTISDLEGLMFGVAKKYRNEAGAVCTYISNDTMYRRIRGIPVGPGDERRVLGMTHGDYVTMEHPHKIQNDIPNGYLAFANLKRYRMYRRLGLNVRVETAGRTLALTHTKIIVVRMRFGGQIEAGAAAAVMSDAQV